MSLSNLLNQTADLQRPTYNTDDSAGVQPVYNTTTLILTGQAVRIEDAKAQEKIAYATQNIVITHRIFVESDVPQANDRWSCNGRYYIIEDILRRREEG